MRKITSFVVLLSFALSCVLPPQALAQGVSVLPWMPPPGTQMGLTPTFTPAHLRGMAIRPNEPFKFDFIVHPGDNPLQGEAAKAEYQKLIKYFLAAMATPDTDQWVNLSPYEHDRIIADNFGLTEMGRDLLAQDYLLKQLSASLVDPNTALGRKFWDRVYEEARIRLGTTDVPADVFNKIWIVPDKAVVYEKENTVLVVESHLKVMTETDYLAMNKNAAGVRPDTSIVGADLVSAHPEATASVADITLQAAREIIVPVIEKEVNEGKSFAPLRQVMSGMLLATWYKNALRNSILSRVYADKSKVRGIDQDPAANQRIYEQYVDAFRKGAVNLIHDDMDRNSQEIIPRKYFSGGVRNDYSEAMDVVPDNSQISDVIRGAGKITAAIAGVVIVGATFLFAAEERMNAEMSLNERMVQQAYAYQEATRSASIFHQLSVIPEGQTPLFPGNHLMSSVSTREVLSFHPENVDQVKDALKEAGARSADGILYEGDGGWRGYVHERTGLLTLTGFGPELMEAWNKLVGTMVPILPGMAVRPRAPADRSQNRSPDEQRKLVRAWQRFSGGVRSVPGLIGKGLLKMLSDENGAIPDSGFRNAVAELLVRVRIRKAISDMTFSELLTEREVASAAILSSMSNIRTDILTIRGEVYHREVRARSSAVGVYGQTYSALMAIKSEPYRTEDQLLKALTSSFPPGTSFALGIPISLNKQDYRIVTITGPMETISQPAVKKTGDKDAAMRGGIDLAQSNLDMQIKRDGKGIVLPVDQQNIDAIKVDGLVPVITGIQSAAASPVLQALRASL